MGGPPDEGLAAILRLRAEEYPGHSGSLRSAKVPERSYPALRKSDYNPKYPGNHEPGLKPGIC
jgi:hypothetical protein